MRALVEECAGAGGLRRAGLDRAQRIMRAHLALRFLPVRCPIGPVEFRHGGDVPPRIGNRRRRGALEGERPRGQAAKTGIDMGAEQRTAAILENVEGRARPRIDFDQRIGARHRQENRCC